MPEKLSKACDACKSKKIKCDRQQPSCGYCRRHLLDCNFSYNRRPGLKPGYGKQIIDRLTELELSMQQYRQSVAVVQELNRKVLVLEQQLDRLKKPSETVVEPNEMVEPMPLLPDISVLQQALRVYLDELYTLFPILHPLKTVPILLDDLDRPLTVLYGVIVVSLPFLDISRDNEEAKLLSYCTSIILDRYSAVVSLETLQAMVLLAFRLLVDRQNLQDVLKKINEGCKSECLYTREFHSETREEVLLAWGIYKLNCYNLFINLVVVTDVPEQLLPEPFGQLFSVRSIHRYKRTLADLCDAQLYESNSFHVEIVAFLARAYTEVLQSLLVIQSQQQIESLKAEVAVWQSTLPPGFSEYLTGSGLKFKDSISIHDILLHSTYNVFQIVTQVAFIFGESTDVIVQNCSAYAQRVVDLCKQSAVLFNTEKLHRIGIMYVLGLWVCGRVIFITSVHLKEELHPDLDFIVAKLYDIANTWKIAQTYADTLTDMKRQYDDGRGILSPFQLQDTRQPMDTFLYHGSLSTEPHQVFNILRIPQSPHSHPSPPDPFPNQEIALVEEPVKYL